LAGLEALLLVLIGVADRLNAIGSSLTMLNLGSALGATGA
jgi:hypothetical protein